MLKKAQLHGSGAGSSSGRCVRLRDVRTNPEPNPKRSAAVHLERMEQKTPSPGRWEGGPAISPLLISPRLPFRRASRRTSRVGQELAPRVRPLAWGCRGFFGPVPQPLWMRSMLLLLDHPIRCQYQRAERTPPLIECAAEFPQALARRPRGRPGHAPRHRRGWNGT